MTKSNFFRKIMYLVGIGILLIPLSLVSRPATRNKDANISDEGGKLARMRQEHELSQANLMEIDPASETMKLASLGLRGVAVNMLWMNAIEYKKTENWDKFSATLKALTKIQPNFVKVWEYQAHNLSYNISMEFDDFEYRYHWVKKGIEFLKEGVPYNRQDHKMFDHLGFFTGHKIGRSDEKDQFRRMFRKDDMFHDSMSEYIEPDSIDTREYGPDNWKMAYWWYDLSRRLVDTTGARLSSEAIYYTRRPAQLRNQGLSLASEFRTDEIIQDVWASAADEWEVYGDRDIRNTLGVVVTMESAAEFETKLAEYRAKLDEYAPPGIRNTLMADVKARVKLTDEEQAALDVPPDQRNDEEIFLANFANSRLLGADHNVDIEILNQAFEENQMDAKRAYDNIMTIRKRNSTISTHNGTTNYMYWKMRNRCESSEIGVEARQALYDAEEMRRRSIFDDDYEIDFETKEKIITRKGAISMYEDAFLKFVQVFEEFPTMQSGELADNLAGSMKDYEEMLKMAGVEWPEDFPLQEFIDVRAQLGEEDDELPTTDDLEEMRSGRKEIEDEMDAPSESDAEGEAESVEPATEEKPEAESSESEAPAEGEEEGNPSGAPENSGDQQPEDG